MKLVHIAIALGLTVIWGVNFVMIHIGLTEIPPFLFVTLRFVIAGAPALFLARPKMSFGRLLAISLTMFVGQFAFLFPGMQLGYPSGLSSLTIQAQAFFTVLLAAATLGERPKPRNILGLAIAIAGLCVIATTVGSNGVTLPGFLLVLAAGLSWAAGNVILRGSPQVDMFALNSWTGLLAVLPMLALSLLFEGASADVAALSHMTWSGFGALAYVAIPTTIVGFWVWAELLKRYPAAIVAPFALLVPVTGTLASFLLLGENFGPVRLAGMALILIGLIVNSLPLARLWTRKRVAARPA